MPKKDYMMSPEEAAPYLGVKPNTLRRWMLNDYHRQVKQYPWASVEPAEGNDDRYSYYIRRPAFFRWLENGSPIVEATNVIIEQEHFGTLAKAIVAS